MLKIAFRNLFRYRKRTIITAIAICFGIAIGIFSTALLDGIDTESNRNLLWYETASIKVYESGWFEDKDSTPIEFLISSDKASKLEKSLIDNDLTSYTKEFIETCDISFYEDPFPSTGSIKAYLKAIDLSTPTVYKFDKSTMTGDWISEGSEGAVIGAKLAEDMGADVGYYITVQTKGKGGFLQAFDVPIIGIIDSGNPVVDSTSIFFDYGFINDILELDGSYSSFALSFDGSLNSNIKETAKILPTVKSIAEDSGLIAHDWMDIASDVIALAQSKSGGSSFIIFFIFIIAIVGVTNTMVMAISERKNEVAMLRSLGYKSSFINGLFCIEGGLIGVFGCIIGSIVGLLSSLYVQIYGIDFSSFGEDIDVGYRINTIMYADINTSKVISICLIAIVFCILAAYLAVRKSTSSEIAVQMRSI
jgi:ABC-type lipoprotein release transport system permease subunit